MSNYIPPENPYESPNEEGEPPTQQSRTWLFVLIAIVAVFVLGACACGSLLLFGRQTTIAPGQPFVIETEPEDATDDSSSQISPVSPDGN